MHYRDIPVPSMSIREEVADKANYRLRRNKTMHRESLLSTLWDIASLGGGRIPLVSDCPATMFDDKDDPTIAEITRTLMEPYDIAPDGTMSKEDQMDLRGNVTELWVLLRSVEITDTPNWYRPSEDLLYALAATKLSGVMPSDVHLPFQAFYIEFPKGALRLKRPGRVSDVTCVGVGLGTVLDSNCNKYPGAKSLILNVRHQGDRHYGNYYDLFEMGDGSVTLDQLVDRNKRRFAPSDDSALSIFGHDGGIFAGNHRAFNMILGFLLYLQQNKATLSHAPTRKVKGKQRPAKLVKAEAKRVLSANSWISGTSCKIDKEVKEAIRGGWSVNRTHSSVVAGHYRRYRVGPRDDWTYEVKWIKPFKRGSKGPILGHSYEGGKT